MSAKAKLLPALLLLSLFLSACIGLIPLEEEPPAGDFGPHATLQEQQTRTFEALWKDLQENYIYYESDRFDWEAVHDRYAQRLQAALTPDEFATLMEELQADLPVGSLVYQSRAERIEAELADASSYEGIGAFVGFSEEPRPHIILLDVIEGSPAEKAGLKAHDSIFEIDGSPVLLEEGLGAVERVRGPAGSTVTLSIKSPGGTQRDIEVKRGKLTSTGKLEAYNIVGMNFGYLLFPPISYDTLDQDVLQALQAFATNRKLEGLILDLRIAGSSRGWPLEALYAMFYDGPLGEFYTRSDRQKVEVKGQDLFGSQDVPLVVLVGQNTSGSPEILAAALQVNQRAAVIGQTTPGSIEGSTSFYLPDGSQAFIETTSFALPNGDEIGTSGVVPDIAIEAGWDEILPNNDPVLDRAIQILDAQS